ncbi:MAG: hypothetical protein V4494_03995 [Chlamydiota bacterium]
MSNITLNNEIQALNRAETHDLYTNFKGELRSVSRERSLTRLVIYIVHGINTDEVVSRTREVINKILQESKINEQIDPSKEKLLKRYPRIVNNLNTENQKGEIYLKNKTTKLQGHIDHKPASFKENQNKLDTLKSIRNSNIHPLLRYNEEITTALEYAQSTLNKQKSTAICRELINKDKLSTQEIRKFVSEHPTPEILSVIRDLEVELRLEENERASFKLGLIAAETSRWSSPIIALSSKRK